MKYMTEVVIDLPRQRVIELMDDPDNLVHWQDGLQSFEHVSGEPGQEGAVSRMNFDQNGRKIEMMETVVKRDFPDEFVARYDTSGVENIMVNRFIVEGPGRTRWITESDFKFGPLMTVLSFFMRGTFKKQTQKTLDAFKTFAESQP